MGEQGAGEFPSLGSLSNKNDSKSEHIVHRALCVVRSPCSEPDEIGTVVVIIFPFLRKHRISELKGPLWAVGPVTRSSSQ